MVNRIFSDTLVFSFLFSLIFCGLCGLSDSLLSFWVFLELCGLSIIPSFFYGGGGGSVYGTYSSLLTYIVMSSLSSIMLVSGILFISLYNLVFWGFVVKFGLFPFSLWVYRVFSQSNWALIFFLSVIMKFPILFFCFLFRPCSVLVVYLDCFFTLVLCSVFIWFLSASWEYVWCHMSLSSVATLMIACYCSSAGLCFFIYFYYCLWGGLSILYFYFLGEVGSVHGAFWVFCFLLLVTPFSLPLFYKLSVCGAVFYSSVYLLAAWCLYSFSEQVFLYGTASEYFYSKVYNSWL